MSMTRDQAARRARKLFGNRAYIRFNPGALDEEERAPLREELTRIRAEIQVLEKRARELSQKTLGRRCSIMRLERLRTAGVGVDFSHHLADGDTWEECFEKAAPKAKPAAAKDPGQGTEASQA